MERVWGEALKLLKSKMLWGLISVFLVANIFIIVSDSYYRKDVNLINKIAKEVGINLNKEGEAKLKEYAEKEVEQAINLVREKLSGRDVDLVEVLNGFERDKFSDTEIERIAEATIIEGYYGSFIGNIERYNKIDVLKNAKNYIEGLKVSEFTKKAYLRGFENFDKRLQEIKAKGENKFLNINGSYRMHKRLFRDTLRKVGIQGLIVIVIATAFLFNYEFENRTSYIVYASKKGRRDRDKLIAALLVGAVFTTILIGITLIVFFSVYNYREVFNCPIDSVLNWETNFPQLSWFNLTVGQFLILNIIIIYIVSGMGVFITSFISKVCKNTYITFFICGILYGILYILPGIFKFNIIVQGISTYTPVSLINGIANSFSMFNTLIANKYFEITTITIWVALIAIGYFIFDKRFKREDL